MPKLNIAHHKSYHPYRRDNIERVRRDEEEARLQQEREEGRISLADSEARIQLLRERAGVSGSTSKKEKRREEERKERELLKLAADPEARRESLSGELSSSLGGEGKHINLFEDLEKVDLATSSTRTRELAKLEKKGKGKEGNEETDKGIPLAPSAKDLKPWYSERKKDKITEGILDDEQRNRDLHFKSRSDPLTEIQRELKTRYPSSTPSSTKNREWGAPPSYPPSKLSTSNSTTSDPARAARESRESSERARAQALKERKRLEARGSATPSTVRGGGDDDFRYGDQFNAQAVADAHRDRERDRRDSKGRERDEERERWRDSRNRGWDDDRTSRSWRR